MPSAPKQTPGRPSAAAPTSTPDVRHAGPGFSRCVGAPVFGEFVAEGLVRLKAGLVRGGAAGAEAGDADVQERQDRRRFDGLSDTAATMRRKDRGEAGVAGVTCLTDCGGADEPVAVEGAEHPMVRPERASLGEVTDYAVRRGRVGIVALVGLLERVQEFRRLRSELANRQSPGRCPTYGGLQ